MVMILEFADVSVDVLFKDIKNVHLSVYPPTGRVRISAPLEMKVETIRLFALSKLGWIRKHQKKVREQERESPREFLERESHYFWGRRYLLRIKDQCDRNDVILGHRSIELNVPRGASLEKRRETLLSWYRKELRAACLPMIAQFEKLLDVNVERFFIQQMKTKWGGSNPTKGYIRLNLDLVRFDPECLRYVILHEMAHFIVPNHGAQFIALLDRQMPEWREIRAKLNYGPLASLD